MLAHPERYWGCTAAKVHEWRAAGAVIQMDTAGLLGKGRIAKVSRRAARAGLVDCFASDNHGDTRTLATARDWLLEVSTPEHAELLTADERAPVARRRAAARFRRCRRATGIFSRFRELFLGR